MARTHYFYFPLKLNDLDALVKAHQEKFDLFLGDNFDDLELEKFEKLIDSLSAVYVQPVLSELSFDDFYSDPKNEQRQRFFFEACKSVIVLEQLPYFETNPFQVSYLIQLLGIFDEVLIDQGGLTELVFKEAYLSELRKFKNIDSLIGIVEKIPEIKTNRPVDPIDFLILDVYKEIQRLQNSHQLPTEGPSEKSHKIFKVMCSGVYDSHTLFQKSGLIAKDFDDNLERLKFWLRKI
jgi:hypothetical protein